MWELNHCCNQWAEMRMGRWGEWTGELRFGNLGWEGDDDSLG